MKGVDIGWASYVKSSVTIPGEFSPKQYTVTSSGNYKGVNLFLNLGVVPSPLILHSSYLIDIELSKGADLPSRDEAIRSMFSDFRVLKNELFENLITDKSRELFSVLHHA